MTMNKLAFLVVLAAVPVSGCFGAMRSPYGSSTGGAPVAGFGYPTNADAMKLTAGHPALAVPTIDAPNPLTGTPLRVGGEPSEDSNRCDRPFHDGELRLSATAAQVCIDEEVLLRQSPHAPAPDIEAIERVVSGDAGKKSVVLQALGRPVNASRCSGDPDRGELVVWRMKFHGCVANGGNIAPTTKDIGLMRVDKQVDGDRPASGSVERSAFLHFVFTK
jgi:hypothetical protein